MSKEKPLVSVAMGIYNCADTLEAAVDCIMNQTYSNWELIMCDDCSTDNTYEVAMKLAEKDSRIKVLKNEKNLTLAPTLNKCICHANGKYIARMDGDDVCDITRFEKEVEILNNNDHYAFVGCQMNLYDSNGIYKIINYIEKPTINDLIKNSQFCHAGTMMRKEALDLIGGYSESPKYNRVEDYDLWTRFYKAGFVGLNIQEILYSMRDDKNAYKRRTFSNRINEIRVKKNIMAWFKLPVSNYIYLIIPFLKALLPNFVYKLLHK